MKLNVYSIYDSAAKAYAQPFFMQNDALALRAFMDNINSEDGHKSNLSVYPEQFTLFKIGEYDDSTGMVINYEENHSLGNGVEFRKAATLRDDTVAGLHSRLDKLLQLIETTASDGVVDNMNPNSK